MVSSKSCEKVGFVFSIFLGGAIPEKHSECGMSRDDTILGVCGGADSIVKGDHSGKYNPMDKYPRHIHRCGVWG